MKKISQYIFGVSFALATFSFISNAVAQTCITPPTCESLGYTLTESKCEGRTILKCPLDTSKVFCVSPIELKTCGTASIGDFLYSDMSCSSEIDREKVVIGIIVSPTERFAIATREASLIWASRDGDDIPGLTNHGSSVKGDYNGKSNTSIIIAHGDSKGYNTPAADYCYNYATEGTNKGDWYLPAGGELQLIYNNMSTLNNSLSKAGGTQLSSKYHWSSSEYGSSYAGSLAWALDFNTGNWGTNTKYSINYVRPVLAY